MIRYKWVIFPLLCIVFLLTSCISEVDTRDFTQRQIRVVTTVGMIADVVENIGGEHVDVHALMGPGVDPHLYRAKESDVSALIQADVIFYGGLHLEARMAEVFERIEESRLTVAVTRDIPEDLVLKSPNFDAPDPHVWMDASLWMYAAGTIRDTLVEMDPAHADDYRDNAEAYLAELKELDDYAREQIARIPKQQRVMITAHDAFQYFGRAYDIEVFAPQGITTASEAGVEDIRKVIDLAVDRNIPAIFVESSVPPDIIEAIIAGADARGHHLNIGGSLYSDAMGEAGTPDGTYIGMIRHNVDTIVSALLGDTAAE